jgi:hypothetical protein
VPLQMQGRARGPSGQSQSASLLWRQGKAQRGRRRAGTRLRGIQRVGACRVAVRDAHPLFRQGLPQLGVLLELALKLPLHAPEDLAVQRVELSAGEPSQGIPELGTQVQADSRSWHHATSVRPA